MYNGRNGDHLLTTKKKEADKLVSYGLRMEGIKFYSGGAVPVYRLYNKNTGEHFYTTNKGEYDALVKRGVNGEGIAFYAKQKGE